MNQCIDTVFATVYPFTVTTEMIERVYALKL